MSHKDPFEVNKFSQYLSTIYRNKLKVHRGKIHDYPEIDLYYSETGVVKVSIIKYLKHFLDKFPKELRGTPSTPEAYHMFQLRGVDAV